MAKLSVRNRKRRSNDGRSTVAEIRQLRCIAAKAIGIFQFADTSPSSSNELLRDALRCARTDLDLLRSAELVEESAYDRAQQRIGLAGALGAYLDRFGAQRLGVDHG
jgi:hypothetical protein